MYEIMIAMNIHKSYLQEVVVLTGLDTAVHLGEYLAIMGPSGCGKSTMLHIMGLLHKPDSGSLSMLGRDMTALSREETTAFRRDHMGFVLQSNNMFSHTTVYENVEFPLIYRKVRRELREKLIMDALRTVQLEHKYNSWSNSLSGGEQQRVAIARALINKPQILLADEPTGALDVKTSHIVMRKFCDVCHEDAVSMIMVTHDPNMAAYCDTVYELEDGRLKT